MMQGGRASDRIISRRSMYLFGYADGVLTSSRQPSERRYNGYT